MTSTQSSNSASRGEGVAANEPPRKETVEDDVIKSLKKTKAQQEYCLYCSKCKSNITTSAELFKRGTEKPPYGKETFVRWCSRNLGGLWFRLAVVLLLLSHVIMWSPLGPLLLPVSHSPLQCESPSFQSPSHPSSPLSPLTWLLDPHSPPSPPSSQLATFSLSDLTSPTLSSGPPSPLALQSRSSHPSPPGSRSPSSSRILHFPKPQLNAPYTPPPPSLPIQMDSTSPQQDQYSDSIPPTLSQGPPIPLPLPRRPLSPPGSLSPSPSAVLNFRKPPLDPPPSSLHRKMDSTSSKQDLHSDSTPLMLSSGPTSLLPLSSQPSHLSPPCSLSLSSSEIYHFPKPLLGPPSTPPPPSFNTKVDSASSQQDLHLDLTTRMLSQGSSLSPQPSRHSHLSPPDSLFPPPSEVFHFPKPPPELPSTTPPRSLHTNMDSNSFQQDLHIDSTTPMLSQGPPSSSHLSLPSSLSPSPSRDLHFRKPLLDPPSNPPPPSLHTRIDSTSSKQDQHSNSTPLMLSPRPLSPLSQPSQLSHLSPPGSISPTPLGVLHFPKPPLNLPSTPPPPSLNTNVDSTSFQQDLHSDSTSHMLSPGPPSPSPLPSQPSPLSRPDLLSHSPSRVLHFPKPPLNPPSTPPPPSLNTKLDSTSFQQDLHSDSTSHMLSPGPPSPSPLPSRPSPLSRQYLLSHSPSGVLHFPKPPHDPHSTSPPPSLHTKMDFTSSQQDLHSDSTTHMVSQGPPSPSLLPSWPSHISQRGSLSYSPSRVLHFPKPPLDPPSTPPPPSLHTKMDSTLSQHDLPLASTPPMLSPGPPSPSPLPRRPYHLSPRGSLSSTSSGNYQIPKPPLDPPTTLPPPSLTIKLNSTLSQQDLDGSVFMGRMSGMVDK